MAKGILHKELAAKLQALLEGGSYAPHDPFMSLREIGRKYKVTPSTALNAVSHLARRGFLYVEHGKGSFVAPRVSTRNILLVMEAGYLSGAMAMFRDGLRLALEEAPEYVEVQESPARFIERLPDLKFHYPALDGIVVFRCIEAVLQSESVLQKLAIPWVFHGLSSHARYLENKNRRLIPQDRIVDTALSYLVDKGHTRIGLVHRGDLPEQNDRHGFFLKWMCDHDLAVRKSNVLSVEKTPDRESALNYTLHGFSKDTDATALFCVDDLTAQRAMNYLVKKGVRIPQDVSIVGVNNYPFCDETITPLTSVDIPWFDDGVAVGRHLLSLIKNPDELIQAESAVSLVERFSTMK